MRSAIEIEALLANVARLATHARVRRIVEEGAPELSWNQAWLLRHLAEAGPRRMSDLAHWQGVDRSTVTVLIGGLERAGLVARVVDPQDRRVRLVSITGAGREVLSARRVASTGLIDEVLASWTPAERDALTQSLDLLVGSLQDHMHEGSGSLLR